MKKLIIFLFFLCTAATSWAQTSNDTIVVAPGPSGMYFYHIVQKGENLQSLSNEFGVSREKLASMNKIKSLKPYELIKIPLHKNVIIQSGNASTNAALTPLYHKVLKGETLYRIGKLYGDLPLSSLKSWNNLQGNSISVGRYLVVGWLQKKPAAPVSSSSTPQPPHRTSPPNNRITNNQSHSTEGHAFLREVIAAERHQAKQGGTSTLFSNTSVADPLLTSSVEKTSSNTNEQTQENTRPVSRPLLTKTSNTGLREQEMQKAPEKRNIPAAITPAGQSPTVSATSTTKIAKADNPFEKMLNQIADNRKKQKEENPKPQTPPQPSDSTTAAVANNNKKNTDSLQLSRKSIFSQLYLAQTQGEKLVRSKKGAAGWFKSNIKPGSKKYYALCNNLPRGTIVKVINPINKKFVYVKVLAAIPEQKENYNLIIKLSDAAMNDLGTNQPRFWSRIIYPKLNVSN